MLGINANDAALIGGAIGAAIAAFLGFRAGAQKKPEGDVVSIASSALADTSAMKAHTQALIGLSEAIRGAAGVIQKFVDAQERGDSDKLDDIRRTLSDMHGSGVRSAARK